MATWRKTKLKTRRHVATSKRCGRKKFARSAPHMLVERTIDPNDAAANPTHRTTIVAMPDLQIFSLKDVLIISSAARQSEL